MKIKYIAVVWSLFATSFSVHAIIPKQSVDQKQASSVIRKIDLNKADLTQLTGSVKGIGKKRAEAIIAYRLNHHGFKSLDELSEVKGIGQHFVDVNHDKLNEIFVIDKME